MSYINIKKSDLLNNEQGVQNAINDLLDNVVSINNECTNLTSSDIWTGLVASKFSEIATNLGKFSEEKLLKAKDANLSKGVVVNVITSTENDVSNTYLGKTSNNISDSGKKTTTNNEVQEKNKAINSSSLEEKNDNITINSNESKKENTISTNNNQEIDISGYKNDFNNGFTVTTDNKTYDLSDKDYELLMAIVSAEADRSSVDDCLAVISVILNRCEDSRWIASHGTSPISQATAPNQFVVYQEGLYKPFLNGNVSDNVKKAVNDAVKHGIRNCDYLSFRSNNSTKYSTYMISSGGNRYK